MVVVGAVLSISTALLAAPPTNHIQSDRFTQRLDRYLTLRRQVVQQIPGPRVAEDAADIAAGADALADAIRAARPKARQGDVFTPKIASQLRRHLRTVLIQQGYRAADLLADRHSEAVRPARPPTVNGRFDWNLDAVMPPLLIQALPALPDGLQYRFVGRDLVLVDILAGLVVDILPRALPHDAGADGSRRSV